VEHVEERPLTRREAVAWTLFGLALFAAFVVLLIQDQMA